MVLIGTIAGTPVKITSRYLREATSSTYRQGRLAIQFDSSLPISWVVSASAVDELEWHSIVNNPRVRHRLHHLAVEVRRQIIARETEEGGFAV